MTQILMIVVQALLALFPPIFLHLIFTTRGCKTNSCILREDDHLT